MAIETNETCGSRKTKNKSRQEVTDKNAGKDIVQAQICPLFVQ
jgi:hypothetical protein